jgi:Dolichyl-phosphate-mannose-protein mannosyltransferase
MRTAEGFQATRSVSGGSGCGGGLDRSVQDGGARTGSRRWAWAGLAVVLAGGLGLRLWGVRQGLPYAYNADEADHFVPHAIAMFGHSLNPEYFANPPAYTYVLHYLFAVWYGGTAGVQRAIATHPGDVYTLARVAAAALGTAALWLLYATGARLFGRGVGLLAAAIEAVAFLPVFYAHLALNDVPTLAPLTLSLLGSAGVLRTGRARDHLLAGVGLGLACASKYTAGIVLVPYLAAVAARYLDVSAELGSARAGRRAVGGIALAGVAALVAFLIANPYAILDYSKFHAELVHQSTLSAEAQGKLGAPHEGGLAYYLWTLTWGLGWVPALAALGGALSVWRSERALGWLLVPAPLLYLAFMGVQGRYFGRWLLPIFPILCLLAALFALQLADAVVRLASRPRRGRVLAAYDAGDGQWAGDARVRGSAGSAGGRSPLRVGLTAVLVAALLAQGLSYSVHSGKVLARADTRNQTRAWMLAHIPAGAAIVVERVAPNQWGTRWNKYPSLLKRISPTGALEPNTTEKVGIEDYERTLAPALVGYYEAHGYCWVVSGSTESGRALADPREVPLAIAYYRTLARRGEVVYRASPYARGQGPVAFDFDWSFDYYPLAYERPGPAMTVYRLHGGRCAR